jgi:ComF family protein
MIKELKSHINTFSHFLFPHHCEGCGSDVLNEEDILCAKCFYQLPATNFFTIPDNPIEKKFYGRINIINAASAYYFTKDSLIQHLLFQLKYHYNKEVGSYFGKKMGYLLKDASRFQDIDVLIPLPLNPKKEAIRGYNQAAIICEGIATVWNKPILKMAVVRTLFTETQTHRSRIDRWENMQGAFAIANATALEGKHILLVDDIVTTGATLEACGTAILEIKNTRLSFAAVANTMY